MNETIFADTFYWIVLLNPRDNFHTQALSLTATLGNTKIITTDEILTEVLNFLSDGGQNLRQRGTKTIRQLLNTDPQKVTVLPQSCLLYTSPSPRD